MMIMLSLNSRTYISVFVNESYIIMTRFSKTVLFEQKHGPRRKSYKIIIWSYIIKLLQYDILVSNNHTVYPVDIIYVFTRLSDATVVTS